MRLWPEYLKTITLLFSVLLLISTGLQAADYDTDGVDDSVDICVKFYDPLQEDSDGDGIGDACDTEGIEYVIDTISKLPYMSSIADLAIDSNGNVYQSDRGQNRIVKIEIDGKSHIIASNPTNISSPLDISSPAGIALDVADNVYFCDYPEGFVYKVNNNGVSSIFAGNGGNGYSGDGGPAISAEIGSPEGVTVDLLGNVFISDTANNSIRKVGVDGLISPFAGSGNEGYSGDGGLAILADLNKPHHLAVNNSGDLYFIDSNRKRIRVIKNGIIETYRSKALSDSDVFTSLSIDKNDNIYYSVSNGSIYKNGVLIAGLGTNGFSGDGGDSLKAELYYPAALAVDSFFGILIADNRGWGENNRVRKMTLLLEDEDKDFIANFKDNCGYNNNIDQRDTDSDSFGDACDLDDDNDGLLDSVEAKHHTDPLIVDTDGDGLTDKQEVDYGTNPNDKDADLDKDGVIDGIDICILFYNPNQEDSDSDNIGDSCDDGVTDPNNLLDTDKDFVADFLDNCVNDKNLDQKNTDKANELVTNIMGDELGDACDLDDDNDGLSDAKEFAAGTNPLLIDTDADGLIDKLEVDIGTDPLVDADFDGDGIKDKIDICALFYDPSQTDSDSDNIGDACDEGVTDPNKLLDTDSDFVADFLDNCVNDKNLDQKNTDKANELITNITGDALGDACDTDDDNDGLSDEQETTLQTNPLLKTDPLKVDTDGDGLNDKLELELGTDPLNDADFDGDGIKDATDLCPLFYDPNQEDSDTDNIGDACDDGVTDPNKLLDIDSDFVADFLDNCDNDKNIDQKNTDGDLQGDVCDVDDDNDTISDADEIAANTDPLNPDSDNDGLTDAQEITHKTNPLLADTDGDGLADALEIGIGTNPLVDADFDGDGIKDAADICPTLYDPDQIDSDTNKVGDVCDTGRFSYTVENVAGLSRGFYLPSDVAFDSAGNMYIADTNKHRVVKVSTDDTLSTIAGVEGSNGNIINANYVKLYRPTSVAVDSEDNIYISDSGNHRIIKISSNGYISRFAGTGVLGFSGDDGAATQAKFANPQRIALDSSGALYVADLSNNRIRMITSDGTISTFAGTGIAGFSGDDGDAKQAEISSPFGLTIDTKDNVYFSNSYRIRKVSTDGTITTIAGTDTVGFSGDNGPAKKAQFYNPYGLAVDSVGTIYIADSKNHRIRKITTDGIIRTIAGTGVAGFTGQFRDATLFQLNYPFGIALSDDDKLYIADGENGRVLKLTKTSFLSYPIDTDNDFVADFLDNCDSVKNTDQLDTDLDQQGDACDTDDDNDGLTDAQEAQYGTDPLVDADFDGDGLSDADEILLYNTLPKDTDSDNDGMDDAWEINNSLLARNAADASQDADADGFWNFAEYLEGSSPQNDQSIPTSLYANVTGLSLNNTIELSVDGLGVSITQNGVQAVPNIPLNQGVYDVSIVSHPANQICILSNHLNVNDDTEAATAIDISCSTRKLAMEDFGFGYEVGGPSSVINFVVKVRDENTGQAVKALTNSDFQVKENGSLISSAESFLESRPIGKLPYTYKLGILLDISQSLLLSDVELAKQAALSVVNLAAGGSGQLKDNTQIAIWTFDGEVTQVQNYTANAKLLKDTINNIVRGGSSTNLNGALHEGMQAWTDSYLLNSLEFGSLIVITDGSDTAGVKTTEQVVSARGDKSVYAIAVGTEAALPANLTALRTLTGEPANPSGEQQRVFTSNNFQDLSAQLNVVVKRAAKFFEGLYAIYYTSPKRANSYNAELSLTQNTNCVVMGEWVCKITYAFNATGFTDVVPELFASWPNQFLSSNTLNLQIETLWSGDPANYTWSVVSADTGMSLTVDSSDSSKVNITAIASLDDASITFYVVDNNYPSTSALRHTVLATDGVLRTFDNCMNVFNPSQVDSDDDGVGDACQGQTVDADSDGVFDFRDNCFKVANSNQADNDNDGFGDACDLTPNGPIIDTDGDSLIDGLDNCPNSSNVDQIDSDSDGEGNACDSTPNGPIIDTDGDSLIDGLDNCPYLSNINQKDSDNDGTGNICDATPNGNIADKDADGVEDSIDNCPELANARQLDADLDGVGDACSNGGRQALDIDGNESVNIFDLLMVQRHVGGVSAIETNIQLPENVGGSGAKGEMTREELKAQATRLLANNNLDVDGNEKTDIFDLLMINRYLGGVQNIALNLKPVEGVNGSGTNGARTSEELRQAAASSLLTNSGLEGKNSSLIISTEPNSDVAAILVVSDGSGMVFYQKLVDGKLFIDQVTVIYPDGQEGRFLLFDDGSGCYEDAKITCVRNVVTVFERLQKSMGNGLREVLAYSLSYLVANANADPAQIDLNDPITGLETVQDIIIKTIQEQLGSLGDKLPFLQNITKQLDEELEARRNFSSDDVQLTLKQIIEDTIHTKAKGLLESFKDLLSFNSVDKEYLDGLDVDSRLDVESVNIETFDGTNYTVEEYKQTIDTTFSMIDLPCNEDSFNYSRQECPQYACGDYAFSSTHAECPNFGEPEPENNLLCSKEFRDGAGVISLTEEMCVSDSQSCLDKGGIAASAAQASPAACATTCAQNAASLDLSFAYSESDGSNARYQRASCVDSYSEFTQAALVEALTSKEACELGNTKACEDAELLKCGIQFQNNYGYKEGCIDNNGNRVGVWNFYNDGSLDLSIEYKDDVPHGEYRRYQNGFIVHEGQFLNGFRNGEWANYDVIGGEAKLTGTYNYADGASTGEVVCYIYDGNELYSSLTKVKDSGLTNGIGTYEVLSGVTEGTTRLEDYNMGVLIKERTTSCRNGICLEGDWSPFYYSDENKEYIRSKALQNDAIEVKSTYQEDSPCP